uniref:Major facilitator superfamily (MFS) profile domain-containing protein n=1 Tax=Graphocephala atropunctata TaxID=36148 RepID=A0A1B6KZM0_9HEMI
MYSHWLLIILFLDLFATSLLVPFLPIHFRNVGLTHLLVGVFTSIYPSMQLFSSPSAGYCSDCYGHKQSLVISLVLCSFAYYFLASTYLVVIFIVRVVLGLLKHTQTLGKAMLLCSKDERHKTFSVVSAVEAFGFMLGPVVGAYFIESENGFQLLCNISTTIFVLNAVIAFCFLPKDIKYQYVLANETVTESDEPHQISLEERKIDWTEVWDIFVFKLFLCISLSLFYTNYALIIIEHFKMSTSMVGYSNSFQGFISIITSLMTSKVINVTFSQDPYVILNYCFLLLSLSLLCMSLVKHFSLFFVFLIPFSSSSTLLRIYTTEMLLSKSTWKNKGSLIGMENTISSLVFFFSPFFFEVCTTNFGTSSVPMVTCFVTFVGACLSEYLHLTNRSGSKLNKFK